MVKRPSTPSFLVGKRMTENSDQFSDSRETESRNVESASQPSVIRLELPHDLVILLQQHQGLGKTQAEVILTLLRSALSRGVKTTETTKIEVFQQEFDALQARLSYLEALMPRWEELEGKLIAF